MSAIITGGSGGIGAAITKKLAAQNIPVGIVVKKSVDKAEQIAARINASGGTALVVKCDVSNKIAVESAVAEIERKLGFPSILINNAGIGGKYQTLDQVSEEEWDLVMNTNVKSMYLFSRILLPKMRVNGYGRIINMSSIYGKFGGSGSAAYSTSKHAIIGLTKSIAAEWGEHGITCNAICPGFVETPMGIQESEVQDHLNRVLQKCPSKRIAQPAEIADLVDYLLSPSAAYFNGTEFTLDGGLTAHTGI